MSNLKRVALYSFFFLLAQPCIAGLGNAISIESGIEQFDAEPSQHDTRIYANSCNLSQMQFASTLVFDIGSFDGISELPPLSLDETILLGGEWTEFLDQVIPNSSSTMQINLDERYAVQPSLSSDTSTVIPESNSFAMAALVFAIGVCFRYRRYFQGKIRQEN